jgi:hypothetical protein
MFEEMSVLSLLNPRLNFTKICLGSTYYHIYPNTMHTFIFQNCCIHNCMGIIFEDMIWVAQNAMQGMAADLARLFMPAVSVITRCKKPVLQNFHLSSSRSKEWRCSGLCNKTAKQVFTTHKTFYAAALPAHDSHCAYHGEMLFWMVALSRASTKNVILTSLLAPPFCKMTR